MRRDVAAVVGVAALTAVVASAVGAPATAGRAAEAACKASGTLVNRVVHYCGPATAHLSTFPGITFRNGTCRHETLQSGSLFVLGMGVRTQDVAKNSGQAYFGLTISGPVSHPTGGGVIAYSGGKRWLGRGVSFKGSASAGTFVAQGIRGSTGTATGSFRC
jgi:hypothetical protein